MGKYNSWQKSTITRSLGSLRTLPMMRSRRPIGIWLGNFIQTRIQVSCLQKNESLTFFKVPMQTHTSWTSKKRTILSQAHPSDVPTMQADPVRQDHDPRTEEIAFSRIPTTAEIHILDRKNLQVISEAVTTITSRHRQIHILEVSMAGASTMVNGNTRNLKENQFIKWVLLSNDCHY